MRILIADDDPVYRSLLADLLGQWRFEPVVVENGLEAWKLIQTDDSPSLIILDWMMPHMDGYEVCKRIRAMDGQKPIYVILLTGSRKKDEVMNVMLAGADDYLIKPFDPVDLKIHIRTAMRILGLEEELVTLRGRAGQPAGNAV